MDISTYTTSHNLITILNSQSTLLFFLGVLIILTILAISLYSIFLFDRINRLAEKIEQKRNSNN